MGGGDTLACTRTIYIYIVYFSISTFTILFVIRDRNVKKSSELL